MHTYVVNNSSGLCIHFTLKQENVNKEVIFTLATQIYAFVCNYIKQAHQCVQERRIVIQQSITVTVMFESYPKIPYPQRTCILNQICDHSEGEMNHNGSMCGTWTDAGNRYFYSKYGTF